MLFKCFFCNEEFTRNSSLNRHLNDKKCTVDMIKLHELHKELLTKPGNIVGENANIIGNNSNNNTIMENVTIIVNHIGNLDTSFIEPGKMKDLVEKYDKSKSNLLLGEYIKDIICNKDHPENHAVKYIKKKPPTYSSLVEDLDGNLINTIKGLKDSCELLEAPILENLKERLTEYIKDFKEDPKYDRKKAFGIWEELKKGAVKKALSSVLKNDILNNLEMKLKPDVSELV
jgi:hypothetical protein